MSTSNSYSIEAGLPGYSRYRVEQTEDGGFRIEWQHPVPEGLRRVVMLMSGIGGGMGIFLFLLVLEVPYPLSIIVAIFCAMPFVIMMTGLIGLAIDKRSEAITLYRDWIEHEPVSTLTHLLLMSVDEWRYEWSNTAMYGSTWDVGYLTRRNWYPQIVRVDVPQMRRSEVQRLTYFPFGEAPECILISSSAAMVVGPFLRHREQAVIARAIQAWLRGEGSDEIAQRLESGIKNLDRRHVVAVAPNRVMWNRLLASPPRKVRVSRDPEGDVVTVDLGRQRLQFHDDHLIHERSVVGFKRRESLSYRDIDQVCELWSGRIMVDYVSDESPKMQSVWLYGDRWIGELVAARSGRPFWRSKFAEDESSAVRERAAV